LHANVSKIGKVIDKVWAKRVKTNWSLVCKNRI
jgi:hypothetical protein